MEQFTVTGMSCAACSTRVEKAVSKVPGVTSCSVSLLTNSMGVEGSAKAADIIRAVEEAGYGASQKGKTAVSDTEEDVLKDKETPLLLKRLLWSVIFLVILMYISMGHMMWNWYLPEILAENHVALGILQLLLTGIIMVINQRFFVSGFKSLFHRAPNMDTLVALGSAAAFIYSTCMLFVMTDAQMRGDADGVMHAMHEFYFESAAMILTLITVGKMLEAKSKGRTTDAIKGLMKLAPKTAVLLVDNIEKEVPIAEVKKDDIFVVRPGETVPVDGIVESGSSAVNESALTGESIPVDKEAGAYVSAGTLNQSGFLTCRAEKVGEDTTLSQIIRMVSDAAATKAPIAKTADKVSGIFVPTVIILAVVTTLVWLLVGESIGFALARGISVLVISCPCALGLATPVAIMVATGIGARNGIMFKTAVSLEETGKVRIAVLDKTGTITRGEPMVTDVLPADDVSQEDLLLYAASLEKKSEHPLAGAVLSYAKDKNIEILEVSDFRIFSGNGLAAAYASETLTGGNFIFMEKNCKISPKIKEASEKWSEQGKTPLFFAKGDKLLGIIAVADVVREDSTSAIREMQNMGIHVVMLTGDNERTARAIAGETGVDEVIAGVLPDGKEAVVRRLMKQGKTAMVGDGINDAPALTRADIGIAIGAGTDIAIDAADVVLMKNSLRDVPAAIRLSRAALKNIHENLFWAFIYNIIGIPLAAGVFIHFLGWQLNPMFAAAAMSLSSFCVVTNALRLNLIHIHDSGKDKKIIQKKKGAIKTMEKTLKIEGMMCGHCEATVKKALEELDGVKEAAVSHTDGTAVVTLSKDVSDEVLTKAVTDKDYKVLSVQ